MFMIVCLSQSYGILKNILKLSLNWDYKRCLHTQGLYIQGTSRISFPTLYKRKTKNYLEENHSLCIFLVIIISLSLTHPTAFRSNDSTPGMRTQWLVYIIWSQTAWPWILDPTRWLWLLANHLISLSLSIITYKIEIIEISWPF